MAAADTVAAAVVATAGKLAPHQDRANFALRIEADAMSMNPRKTSVLYRLPAGMTSPVVGILAQL